MATDQDIIASNPIKGGRDQFLPAFQAACTSLNVSVSSDAVQTILSNAEGISYLLVLILLTNGNSCQILNPRIYPDVDSTAGSSQP